MTGENGNIIFDEIPVDRLEPGTFLEVKPNYTETGLLPMPVRNLIIAPKLPEGRLEAGKIVEITRGESAQVYFGRGSIGAAMATTFRKANKSQPLYIMALDDAADGVAAEGSIAFSGSVTNSTSLRFLVAGNEVRFNAPAGASGDLLANRLATAINENLDLPVTATTAGATVKTICRHKGEIGNDIDLRVYDKAQPLPIGLAVNITPMAGGSGNPALQAALDQITNSWYTTIVQPFSDASNITAFATFLQEQFLATQKMDAIGFTFKSGSYADLSAFGALTNCAQLVCSGVDGSPTPSWVMAASAGAVAAFHLANDPSRQLKSLVLPSVIAPDEHDQFIDVEKDNLLRRGITTLNCLPDGAVTFSRVISTYKTNNLGIDDRAWLDIMTTATMTRIRYDFSSYLGLLYPRAKLASDESPALSAIAFDTEGNLSNAIVTPRIMAAVWAGRCRLYANNTWIVNVEKTVKQSSFHIAENDKNRLEAKMVIDIVGNLMVFAGALEFKARS